MHKNNRQEILFQAAFKLFLLRQFKGVTLADIEQEAGMTRGAIFYHARNKEDLYRKVVKRYWIDNQDIINQVDKDSVTLKEFINNYTASINKMMQELQKLLPGCSLQQVSKAYLSFLMQLRDSAPDLHDEYLSNRTNQLFAWNDVLRNAVANGEIIKDIDTFAFAQAFLYLFYGQTFWESLDNGLNIDQLRRNYMKIYDAIKIR